MRANVGQLSEEEQRCLDVNGYVVLENVLESERTLAIIDRLEVLKRQEGIRVGEIRDLEYRKSLTQLGGTKKRLLLTLNALCFRVMKYVVGGVSRKSPFINQMLYSIVSDQHFYRRSSSGFRSDLSQMLLNIVQQQEENVDRICNLVNKGEEFEVFFTHDKVLSAVKSVIGIDFKLSSLNLRAPKLGSSSQHLHVDWPWTVGAGEYYAVNTIWFLDDVDEQNGPTRLVPGSHKMGKLPAEVMSSVFDKHPEEITVSAKAGSVLIINSHIWHGGTQNESGKSRRAIQSYFVHRAHQPQQYQRLLLTEETRSRLDQSALRILDAI